MRDMFPGYYSPTKDEYEQLWTEGLFVLDTNILLNLYRLPKGAREDLFEILEQLSDSQSFMDSSPSCFGVSGTAPP